MNRGTVGIWSLALLTFGVGDVATTWYGLQTPGVMESNAVPALFIQQYGILGMIAMKLTFITVMYIWYLSLSDRTAGIGIPSGLAVVGTLVTVWNLSVIVTAVG